MAWLPRDILPLSFTLSNKPNPNQISVNNVKAGVVNGAGAPGQSPGAGRACESCYSKCPAAWHPGHTQPSALGPDHPGGRGPHPTQGSPPLGVHGVPGPAGGVARRAGDSCGMLSAVTGSA